MASRTPFLARQFRERPSTEAYTASPRHALFHGRLAPLPSFHRAVSVQSEAQLIAMHAGDFCSLGHYSPIPATNEASMMLPHRPVCRDPFCRCNRYRRHDLIVVTTFEMPNHLVMSRQLSACQTAKLFVTNLGPRQIPSLFSSRDCDSRDSGCISRQRLDQSHALYVPNSEAVCHKPKQCGLSPRATQEFRFIQAP